MATQKPDPAADLVDAAKTALDPGNTPLGRELASSSVAENPQDRPQALIVDGVQYVFMPEVGAGSYASEDGELLDLTTPAAVKELFAWRRQRMEKAAREAAEAEREEKGLEDVHTFEVGDVAEMAAFEAGRRWLGAESLVPGTKGNDGIKAGHAVMITYRSEDGQRDSVSYTVVHVGHEDVPMVSIEPGERVAAGGVVFTPKPHIRAWLEFVATAEGMTVDRYLRRMLGQAYQISELRPGMGGTATMAGRVGGEFSAVMAGADPERSHVVAGAHPAAGDGG